MQLEALKRPKKFKMCWVGHQNFGNKLWWATMLPTLRTTGLEGFCFLGIFSALYFFIYLCGLKYMKKKMKKREILLEMNEASPR